MERLRNSLTENITLEETAKQWGISVRSLIRLFQTKLHITFIQYIKMLRIIRAMELIKDSNLNMTEIAYEIGYSDISAFSNNFYQLTNMRPSQFKAMSS
ncbi:helix-turn-helix transcriptional regulator [Chryseobacterium sp. OSA05B]|uniref:helix-turn-helix transcriptional regulator n=1 Tax=Chryseobacterium sp. OSA05B TaxID=2862650 RepID=UPI001CC0AC0F|nr:helix-turn-helix transcriptional regulator [Chryseobacterium sp. OSA05B]